MKTKRKINGEIWLQCFDYPQTKRSAEEYAKMARQIGMHIRVIKRKEEYYPFMRKKDIGSAMRMMKYIKREVKNKGNQQRWGEKYTNRHIKTVKELRIAKRKYKRG